MTTHDNGGQVSVDYVSWSVTAGNAVAGAVLINAGVAKLVSPAQAASAVRELVPAVGSMRLRRAVRALATLEALTAVALLLPWGRIPAAILIGTLGAGFAAAGALGKARRGSVPCGCFGWLSRPPLGWTNVVLGTGLVAVAVLNTAAGRPPSSGTDYITAAVPLTTCCTLALCLLGAQRSGRARPSTTSGVV